MYQEALVFIAEKHNKQKRRNGNPYIIHPIRVSQEVKSDTEKVVALLHDTLEDTETTIQEITQFFGQTVAEAVLALTRLPEEAYLDYIRRLKPNPIAKTVKIADISDNLSDSPSRAQIEMAAKALDLLVNDEL